MFFLKKKISINIKTLINHQTLLSIISPSIIRSLKDGISMKFEPDRHAVNKKRGKKSDTSVIIQSHFMIKPEAAHENKEHGKKIILTRVIKI